MRPVADYGRVAVLYGGSSAERDISLNSGRAVLAALQSKGIDAIGIDPAEGLEAILNTPFDRAFIALHGRGGEDGSLQGLLELMERPYTGSGVLASALGMNKLASKRIWHSAGLPTPNFMEIRSRADLVRAEEALGLPLMIKPNHEGSSIGITRVDSSAALLKAYETAARFDSSVLAETCIQGCEYTIAIVADEALPVIRLATSHSFFDYDAKYGASDTEYRLPSGLSAEDEREVQDLSLRACHLLGCRGWARVDLMIDARGPWLLEVNTVPGMTMHSLVPKAAAARGEAFADLVCRILGETL